jgi:rfaE bifunctional protein nucleotidyltransferase chain/domain
VLLNDDDSVRRLKGAGRPIVTAAERAELLRALEIVDEVRIFSEDTPERALAELRPDVYVKGGDYAGATLPERELVEASGGRVVIVPYEDGRSTTALIDRAVLRTA